jgi:hypothetical protein
LWVGCKAADFLCKQKNIVMKSKVKTGCNLAESSKDGYGCFADDTMILGAMV